MIELHTTKIKGSSINEVLMTDDKHFLWVARGKDRLCIFFDDNKPEINIDYWGESEIIVNKI